MGPYPKSEIKFIVKLLVHSRQFKKKKIASTHHEWRRKYKHINFKIWTNLTSNDYNIFYWCIYWLPISLLQSLHLVNLSAILEYKIDCPIKVFPKMYLRGLGSKSICWSDEMVEARVTTFSESVILCGNIFKRNCLS